MGFVYSKLRGKCKGKCANDECKCKRKVYYICYRVNGKRRREKVGFSRDEAGRALQSRETDIRRGKFDGILPEPTCTLAEIHDQYLAFARTTKSANTLARETSILKAHLIPEFGKAALNEITAEQLESYRTQRRVVNGQPASINKEIQVLRFIIRTAQRWGKIRSTKITEFKPLKPPPGRTRYLANDQLAKLVQASPAWLRPIVVVLANTGMRRSEVMGLRKRDIDRKNGVIILEKTKNNERRPIPINATVQAVLDGLPPRLDTQYLFAEHSGHPIAKGKVSAAFKRACKKAGIREFRLHDLRHHFASHLAMNGQNMRTIQELLGHKDPKMTMRYSHLSAEHLKAAVQTLDGIASSEKA